jgi:tetratricopeptide (TPR) repeat protein
MSKILVTVVLFTILILSSTTQSGPYSDLYNNIKKSVVFVQASNSQNEPISRGTGFFIDKAGYIITNFHIINGSSKANVTTADGHNYRVKNVLAEDIFSDLACLSVDIPSQLIYPVKVNTSPPEVGEDIFVIGYPEGPGGLTQSMTRGIVSSIQTLNEYGKVIQIDAAVSPGASGSPLVNMKHETIGVATFGYIKGQNQNFAVSCDQISKLIQGIYSAQAGKQISEWNLTPAEVSCAIGVDLYRKGEYNLSIYYSEEAIRLDPQYALAWYSKGIALNSMEKYDEAIKAFDEAIRLEPILYGGAEAWVGKGYALDGLGKYNEAIEAYDKAINLDQNFSSAWNNKAYALEKLGNYQEAITASDKAIEIDPQNKEAWNNKCKALNGLGKFFESIKICDLAIQMDEQNAGAWGNKGIALHALGQDNEAINCFEKVIEIDPLDVNGWFSKGTVLMDLGKSDEAILALDKATELDANHSSAWNNKGLAFADLARYDDAIGSYDRAIGINPQHVDAWLNKGTALFELGRYNEAVQAYNQAIEINPQDFQAWRNIGLVFEAQGRNVEAYEAFNKAKELNLGNLAANGQFGSDQSSVRSEKITGTGSFKKDYYIENKANDSATVLLDIKNANYYEYTYRLYSDELRSSADLDIVVKQAESITCSGNAKNGNDISTDITMSIKNGNLTCNNFVASSDQGVQVSQKIIDADGDNIYANDKASGNDSVTIENNIEATYSEAFQSMQELSVGRDTSTVVQINAITGPLNVSSYIAAGDRKLNAIADVDAGVLSIDQAVNLYEANQRSKGVIGGATFDTLTTNADRKKKRAYTEVGSGNLINLFQITSLIDAHYEVEYEYMPSSYQTRTYDLNLNSSKVEGI